MTLYFIPSFLCNREVFINPKTGDVWQEGDTYKRESFGRTLQKIARNGVDEFYVGETAKNLIGDVTRAGGIITLEDLRNYEQVVKYIQGDLSLRLFDLDYSMQIKVSLTEARELMEHPVN